MIFNPRITEAPALRGILSTPTLRGFANPRRVFVPKGFLQPKLFEGFYNRRSLSTQTLGGFANPRRVFITEGSEAPTLRGYLLTQTLRGF
jgi:hypothetical protein